jgi:anthranilate phosphoribosyltransferase
MNHYTLLRLLLCCVQGTQTNASSASPNIRDVLAQLARGASMREDEAHGVFSALLRGELEESQIAALLASVQVRGVSVDELVGGARAMRAHVTPLPGVEPTGTPLLDTCGTGGAPKAFNVSTLAAIVAAAAAPGILRVAKHGNRSRTGRGSAELLSGLGVNIDATPAQSATCLKRVGVCFCFAMHYHPAMRFAAPVRKSLGFPTIFNVLGPLTNPARAQHQLLGVYGVLLAERVAHALVRLGARRAWVFTSDDGLDELSVTAPARVFDVSPGGVQTFRLDPARLGLARATFDQIAATDIGESVRVARALFDGEHGPKRDMLLLNVAAALVVSGVASDLGEGMERGARAIDDGHARATLERLIATSRE